MQTGASLGPHTFLGVVGCAKGLGKLVPTPDTPSRPRGTELEREQGKSPGKEGELGWRLQS